MDRRDFFRAGLTTVTALTAAWVVLLGFCAAGNAGEKELFERLLPRPQQGVRQDGLLPVVAQGKARLCILTPEKPHEKETLAAEWLAREIHARGGVAPTITTDLAANADGPVRLLLATYGRETELLKQAAGLLDRGDRELLSDPARAEQGYVIRSDEKRIAVVGGSAQGTLYGAMTLLQLLQGGRGDLSLPRVHVRDWPDFKHRVAENWTYAEGREHWGRGWLYDWGDGTAGYKRRVESILDRCLRYKINMICFSSGFGESFSDMWNPDAFPMQKELNRLADRRGVKLMIGGYGIACDDPTLRNRRSYPGGEEYVCLTTGNMGNCRSNDDLTKRIQDRFREYVRKTEPRALYIHFEDSDTYASAEWLWKHRCEQCRKRWPNDESAAADGAAGGFVRGYDAICDAIFSVKNPDSGYDASRDCLVILVSPTYTADREPDAVWNKQLAYWKTVGGLLKHRKNVCIGIREQFLRADNGKRRILEMAETLRRGGDGPGLFLFFVSRASLYERGPLFVPVPAAMSRLNEGAEVAYYMCGRIFQEPMILMNGAHMWNRASLGNCEIPATAPECLRLYKSYARRETDPPKVFGPGGFLELACQTLYGPKAGKHMEKLYAMPTVPILHARGLFAWPIRGGWYYDWAPEVKATREALAHVEAALREVDAKHENRVLLERFQKCLEAGEQFGRIRLAYQQMIPTAFEASTTPAQMKERAARIEAQIAAMEAYLKSRFSDQWATPRGGDSKCWRQELAKTREEVALNAQRWTQAIVARRLADREEAAGRASLILNGDMEESTGWKFASVTNEEDAGYADGGYVTDRSTHGKRAYRIVKRPVNRVSDKWPAPQRATWGEIVQEIRVQPGRKYVVAFEVFSNYGDGQGAALVEHQVLVDEQEMWSLDASAPIGWKSGGFHFVPKTSTIRLRLKTTDVRACYGWGRSEGDSWWDRVRMYPVQDDSPTHDGGSPGESLLDLS